MTEWTGCSRRNFFRRWPAAAAAALWGQPATTALPTRAWIILECGWEHDDEYAYQSGYYPESQVYFDQEAAAAECRRLCAAFFAAQTPQEFNVDFGAHPDIDEETATWDALLQDGFPAPFTVEELTA
jgi:hypothetical protein